MKAGDRLLARIAALGEADGALDQPRLRGQNALVDLPPEARRAGRDPKRLQLLLAQRAGRRWVLVEHLDGRNAVVLVPDASVGGPEEHERPMLLELDLRLRREAALHERCSHRLTELGLSEKKVVLTCAPHYPDRREHTALRRQEERVAGVTGRETGDVVRQHGLEVVRGLRTGDPDERARSAGDRGLHSLFSVRTRGGRLAAPSSNQP